MSPTIHHQIGTIVEQYKNGQSLRTMAEAISAAIEPASISHQTVANWISGQTPDTATLLLLHDLTRPADWRHQFACDLLDVLVPEWRVKWSGRRPYTRLARQSKRASIPPQS